MSAKTIDDLSQSRLDNQLSKNLADGKKYTIQNLNREVSGYNLQNVF
jgi:hypothetical protein